MDGQTQRSHLSKVKQLKSSRDGIQTHEYLTQKSQPYPSVPLHQEIPIWQDLCNVEYVCFLELALRHSWSEGMGTDGSTEGAHP